MDQHEAQRIVVIEQLRAALGALLLDDDVGAIHLREGGEVSVTRRGRQERLPLTLPEGFFTSLRQCLGASVELHLEVDGHPGTVVLGAAGAVLCALVKRPPREVSLDALVEETLLSAAEAARLVIDVLAGRSLLITGPARDAARRLTLAVGRALAEHALVMSLDEDLALPWALPAPLPAATLPGRASAAARLGAEALLSTSMSLEHVELLAAAALPCVVVARVDISNPAALLGAPKGGGLDVQRRLAAHVVQVGRAPSGRPRVLAFTTETPSASAPTPAAGDEGNSPPARPPVSAATPVTTWSTPAPPPAPFGGPALGIPRAGLGRAAVVDVDELPPLAPLPVAPPSTWASTAHDDGPGWELGEPDTAPAASSTGDAAGTTPFGAVLSEVRARPSFVPRPPAPHPQTRALRGDPFGGLSLEPPGGTLDDVPPLPSRDDEPGS